MFANMLVFNTKAELNDYLDSVGPYTLVNRAAFAADLLDFVRSNDNVFNVDYLVDDGEWIEIDNDGYVVADMLNG